MCIGYTIVVGSLVTTQKMCLFPGKELEVSLLDSQLVCEAICKVILTLLVHTNGDYDTSATAGHAERIRQPD